MAPHLRIRQQRLFRELRHQSIERLLITSPFNVTYLTGFTGEDSFLYVEGETLTVWSDARYEEQIGEECPDLALEIRKPTELLVDAIPRWLGKKKVHALHVETGMTSYAQWERLSQQMGAQSLTPCNGIVERLRECKDDVELAAIERAIQIAERAFLAMRSMLADDWTEKKVADTLETNIRQLGGTTSAFKSIVGVGPRAALPHGRPSSKTISEDPFVLVDWGAKEDLYLSDITRVILTGKPSSKLQKVYQTVLHAQMAAIHAIRPGVLMSEIDAIARGVIEQAGFGKRFTHSLGHGFGLQIHETVRLARGQDRPLEPNMVVTVEPGIYLPGVLGVRIEDDILVTKDGHRVLSHLPKEWDEIA
ncbi:putative peptidase [Pirellula sp. SH-Sr6A]|uniref:M24 family metallopeptidase n=1 Tax=Pirellula sp. SH-Sr6A TaxID=1632865 RepID=UPI00078B53D8|nr:Xaa-Pro peptidase family protein [Pirellula sp. SH-Sr6A]AMV33949.1 putative peptidase [Pirellula sp. SH-Sr6A]